MYLSYNFIKQYVKLPADITPKDVALALTMSTVEVEDVIDQAADLDGIVVGKVIDVVKHPQADRLWVCRVDVKTEILQIICGGTNVVKNMYVAVAKVGAKVKWHGEGERITLEKAKIRGLESNGMIAASDEIGLHGLFPAGEREILDLSPYQVRVGDPIAVSLGLTDTIFEIDNKSMTHRPDLWGQYGLAREIAAIYQTSLKPLKVAPIPSVTGDLKPLTVTVKDSKLCPRYAALVIDQVSPVASPWWLKRDLEEVGITSINAIVDITNYVTMVLGQPMHAFDYHKLAGHKIVVDRAGVGKKFTALNGKDYELPSDTLMINDGEQAVAIAGIIGGAESAITDATKTIVFEVANFEASSVRRSSMALGLRTEASARFEKKLDPTIIPDALAMACDLIMQLVPGARVASKVMDIDAHDASPRQITVTKEFLDRRLGAVLDAKEIVSILKRLAFSVVFKKNIFSITVPSFRAKGITIPEDIVEEVARIYGYNNIKPALPIVEIARPSRNPAARVERECRTLLAQSFGYHETYSYSFADALWCERMGFNRNRVLVKNAIAKELSYMRASLLPGLVASAVSNIRWKDSFKLFELGRVFSKTPGEFAIDASSGSFLPSQPLMLSGIAVAKAIKSDALYREVKGDLEGLAQQIGLPLTWKEVTQHSFGTAVFELRAGSKPIGLFGMLKQEFAQDDLEQYAVVFWDLQFELLVKFATFAHSYIPVPKFPAVARDIAIIVASDITWGMIEHVIQKVSPLITRIELFDVFTSPKLGEGKKSIAFSLTFASPERTLESSEVDAIIQKIAKLLAEKCGAVIR